MLGQTVHRFAMQVRAALRELAAALGANGRITREQTRRFFP